MKKVFIPGKALSRSFYNEVVRNLVEASFPGLPYSAGLMDYGSDVLGFDDDLSCDHQWGPRLSIFLSEIDLQRHGVELDRELSRKLPREFKGYSTNFSGTRADYIRRMEFSGNDEVSHIIRILSPNEFFLEHLGFDISRQLTIKDWLLFSQQRLLTIQRGEIFHDDLNIVSFKNALEYYPVDIWLYLMSVEWQKIASEEAFVGRTGERNDELGSRIIGTRIVERLIRLYFLQRRQYFPYSKWFGTAFSQLDSSGSFAKILNGVLKSRNWEAREKWLCRAYVHVAKMHNDLKLTPTVDPKISNYYGRPFKVIFASRFSEALIGQIKSSSLLAAGGIGNIDQLTDNLKILESVELARERIRIV